MLTEDSIWTIAHGEERAGFIAYGYWPQSPPLATEPVFPRGLWDTAEASRYLLRGEDWLVLLWNVAIDRWPRSEEWPRLIETTLHQFIQHGARVAWCSSDGHFADPPSLFDPDEMGNAIFAVYSERGFQLTARLGEEFKTISDAQMLEFRKLL